MILSDLVPERNRWSRKSRLRPGADRYVRSRTWESLIIATIRLPKLWYRRGVAFRCETEPALNREVVSLWLFTNSHLLFSSAPVVLPKHSRFLIATAMAFLMWAFCPWCGRASLVSPRLLVALVKDPPNLLDELEKRLRCQSCKQQGVKLVPTDRTEISFDPMGVNEKNTTKRCACGWYATRYHGGTVYCARCFEQQTGKLK